MKSVISLIVALFIFSIDGFAGTPGNDDVSIIYGLAIGFLALILGIDYLIRFVKKRRLNKLSSFILLTLFSTNIYCQKDIHKPINIKSFIEIGGGKNIKSIKWDVENPTNNTSAKIIYFDRNSSFQSLNINFTNGFFLKSKIFLGVSVGVEQYKGNLLGVSFTKYLLPLGLQARYYFTKGPIKPLIILNSGYAFANSKLSEPYYMKNNNGGLYFQPSIGAEIPLKVNTNRKITICLGYKVQKINTTVNYMPWYYNYYSKYNYNRLETLTFSVAYSL
jgi:hypothetical protein